MTPGSTLYGALRGGPGGQAEASSWEVRYWALEFNPRPQCKAHSSLNSDIPPRAISTTVPSEPNPSRTLSMWHLTTSLLAGRALGHRSLQGWRQRDQLVTSGIFFKLSRQSISSLSQGGAGERAQHSEHRTPCLAPRPLSRAE